MDSYALESFLAQGVERLMRDIIRVSARDPRSSAFILKFSAECMRASKKRERSNRKGSHVPPFLICSLTDDCGMDCEGCYAKINSCHNAEGESLSANDWLDVFVQAAECGVNFILLAGGEPLLRRDVIFTAARCKNLFFPIFTSGTVIDSEYVELFDKHRNLFPLISIEGEKISTDSRRGDGVYDTVTEKMVELKNSSVLFGVSVTVTKENVKEVFGDEFISDLNEKGCKAVVYVEYVPVDGRDEIAPDEETRAYMALRLAELRKDHHEMMYISFPGDEKASGGCLSSGRGFFHINSRGGAEPCPFAPYSDCNVRDMTFDEVMKSPLFSRIRDFTLLECEHGGGCVLFERQGLINALMPEDR
ncbi:radical SAM protein [Ruminococcus albus]|uniref:Radical SAM superfamily enzyme, MoaA/NifB/PqqE/SkfB family n=1 Tax=Ruminococcus albus TaxID=1264 RepID=A0A1H7NHA6_RUMAL|nr:radical SAM protein [Ruminococcus albus]SEL22922.1 Radical SAM superfamily enzyme, MoaA/NifB/PqqE/SkfB family [Ruminococcus albus]